MIRKLSTTSKESCTDVASDKNKIISCGMHPYELVFRKYSTHNFVFKETGSINYTKLSDLKIFANFLKVHSEFKPTL